MSTTRKPSTKGPFAVRCEDSSGTRIIAVYEDYQDAYDKARNSRNEQVEAYLQSLPEGRWVPKGQKLTKRALARMKQDGPKKGHWLFTGRTEMGELLGTYWTEDAEPSQEERRAPEEREKEAEEREKEAEEAEREKRIKLLLEVGYFPATWEGVVPEEWKAEVALRLNRHRRDS